MRLDKYPSSAVKKELEIMLMVDREHKKKVCSRLKRMCKHKYRKSMRIIKWFYSINHCIKCQ